MLAWNKCLTWDNIRKRGFQGPSVCVLCEANEEDSAHLFFRCPFSLQIWHFWWGVWNNPCVHASSLIEFWQRLGRPPSMASFLQEVWSVGPIFLLWQIWLERNRRIFRGEKKLVQQIWQRTLGMVQETVVAKCEVEFPLEKRDAEVAERLGIQGMSLAPACVKRGRHLKQKVHRSGCWQFPPFGVLKINTDGSSRGNPGPAGLGGIGRDSLGSVVFLFSIYEGVHTINLMEGMAILYAFEEAYDLGWRRVVCESDSQVLINLLIRQKVDDVSWQLAGVVQQILRVSSLMEMVTFVHIPREWNRAADCLAKWASEHVEGWRIEEWEMVPQALRLDLERILAKDREENGDG